jgi:hypothetical protein
MQKCKRAIDAMRCDHFQKFSECDANAKMDPHYLPCAPPFLPVTLDEGRKSLLMIPPSFPLTQMRLLLKDLVRIQSPPLAC